MVAVYRDILNYVPAEVSLAPLVEGLDYTRHGCLVKINSLTVPSYTRAYANGPAPVGFSTWPVPIGRYSVGGNVVDVVFGLGNGSSYHFNPVGEWDANQTYYYTKSIYGIWPLWKYEYLTNVVATLTMTLIKDLPAIDRVGWKIARHLAAKLDQSNHTDGVIYGKWDGSYSDGVNPTSWTSSAQICYTRLATGKPIKYGQCWVFAETLTAMCRFLNIPARTVQAYGANIDIGCNGGNDYLGSSIGKSSVRLTEQEIIAEALDTTVDLELGESQGQIISKCHNRLTHSLDLVSLIKDGDSSWNFHLWNEIYTKRGWEILDACPIPDVKTENVGIYANKHFFGPCPVKSIRDGVRAHFDYPYLSSAINGVPREWEQTIYEGEKIIYPTRIIYEVLDGSYDYPTRVELFTKGHYGKDMITGEYRYPVLSLAMRAYHREHPFYVEANGSLEKLKVRVNERLNSDLLVQLVYLHRNTVLLCKRYRVTNLVGIKFPLCAGSSVLSILIVDVTAGRFWTQMVRA